MTVGSLHKEFKETWKLTTDREMFRLCACCPCPCRRVIASDSQEQIETATPSAMSMIALAILDGALDFDSTVQRAFNRTEVIRPCKAVCPYGLDIADAIDKFATGRVL